ncbi:transcriptional regulator [Kaistia sp. 32K]|uniref:ArsR/SmtB family transcription factor n=1 Tax=Kaistia sp. 32K TaxID=2795690 RepID=UPI00191629EC|nr:metalloregulator ArsR/SmtB family transcription factor [Kaistia sp. 32K]BCP55772.1 transcriptional regulator [Kaistia sp. 32K]
MVDYSAPLLDDVFHALADPTRRAMVARLSQSEQTVSELAAPFSITLAAASKHIKVLERAGLIARTVSGRTHVCRLDAAPIHAGMEWMRHYEKVWQQSLDRLEDLLVAEDAKREDAERETGADPNPKRDGKQGVQS